MNNYENKLNPLPIALSKAKVPDSK